MFRVLIVSDIGLYREGLRIALDNREEFIEVATASNTREALAGAENVRPEVILVDHAMENALGTMRSLTQARSEWTLIALSVPNSEDNILACAEAGASAYLTHHGSIENLIETIRAAREGRLNCSPKLACALFKRLGRLAPRARAATPCNRLSPRESQVLELIERGLSNKEISRSLGIETATVKNHVHNILEKLEVSRRGQAAALRRMG